MYRRFSLVFLFVMLASNVFGADQSNLLRQLHNIQQQHLIETQRLDRLGEYGLRLLRNGVFAAHGRLFHSEELNYFFYNRSDIEKQFGFKVNSDYNDSMLTEIDKQNIDIVLQTEKSLEDSWKEQSISLDEVLDSYHLDDPEAYSLHDRNGDAWTTGIVGPSVYRVYPNKDNPLMYYILLEDMMLMSDSFVQRTFRYENGEYTVLDFENVTSGLAIGYYTQAMTIWHEKQDLESFEMVRADVKDVVTELYVGGISVKSYNTEWLKRNLEEGW